MAFAAQRQELLGTERPYPGQLWRRGSLQVIIVAVSPTTVTYAIPWTAMDEPPRAWTPL